MSYCRWSDLRGQCDVYVYEDVDGGWTTHVAVRRRTDPEPISPVEEMLKGDPEAFSESYAKLEAWRDAHPPQPIGLSHDGETFHDSTPGECAERLRELRRVGYVVPNDAIEALEKEHAEKRDRGWR